MTMHLQDRLLDVRPDRIDLRDRQYTPLLRSLPEVYPSPEAVHHFLPLYGDFILDQGSEGACTGFGLACVVNYLHWTRRWRSTVLDGGELPTPEPIDTVSPRMLYHLARFYDEWPGEDYEGSSCRGTMKGWHYHGVCSDTLWPYRNHRGRVTFVPPSDGWQEDAATRPLGAYYRVNKDSVADMQAAIYEVGAVYASALVHDGWMLDSFDELPAIDPRHEDSGGHAFALVGYCPQGFIVQNSWGPEWGYHGFAILQYADWVQRGMDAWVAVLGAPVSIQDQQVASLEVHRTNALSVDAAEQRSGLWFFKGKKEPYAYENEEIQPWTRAGALRHSVVMGNDGDPLNRILVSQNAAAAVRTVCYDAPSGWFKNRDEVPKIAIYAHGGLNDEEAALTRARILAPYFTENGIYPLFLNWKTGFRETLRYILEDLVPVRSQVLPAGSVGLGTTLDSWRQRFGDARDRTLEAACGPLAKPVWTQMKQNAALSIDDDRALNMLCAAIAELRSEISDLEVHLIGHSAGAILLGHLMDLCVEDELPIGSCTLYAPACTVAFARKHFGAGIDAKVIGARNIHIEILSDERELDDSIGPYGKSLLYLVSRALEVRHKTPLLGMEREWSEGGDLSRLFGRKGADEIKEWRQFWKRKKGAEPKICSDSQVSDGQGTIPATHGSFDNNVDVVTRTIERLRGDELEFPIETLRGF